MLPCDRRARAFLPFAILAVAILAVSVQIGCAGPKAFIREGTADSVEISYAHNLEATAPLARGYCLRYDRSPVLASADGDIAVYNCIAANPPRPAPR